MLNPTIDQMLAQARVHYGAGRLLEAESLYRQILLADSSNAEVSYLLGSVCHDSGNLREAAVSLRKAIELQPCSAESHHRLGVVLAHQGDLNEAVECFRKALQLRPDSIEISANLRFALAIQEHDAGSVLASQGRLSEAVACYRRSLELNPDFTDAYDALASVLTRQHELDQAVACYRRSVELEPKRVETHNKLGILFLKQAKFDEAVAHFQRAVALKPDHADALNNLGVTLAKQNKFGQAVGSYRRALALDPNHANAHYNLGTALMGQGKFEEAATCYHRALALNPDRAEAHYNLAYAQLMRDELDQSAESCRRALELNPDYPDAHNNLGDVLMRQGRVDEAMKCFRRTLQLDSRKAKAHSNILLAMHYQPTVTPGELAAEHSRYEELHAAPLRTTWQTHGNARDPDRRLRMGFVSGDLGFHPVGYFLVRMLENLDDRQVEVVCYSDRLAADAMTNRIRTASTRWYDVHSQNDQQLADQIRDDEIDVLFDLAGHTSGNRLLVFARKPAPIQVTWIGYVGTTGLTAMDYLLADRYQVPDIAETFMRERVLRMPEGYVCYDPPIYAPPVGPLAASRQGYVTFGSFNYQAKINARVIDVWSRILRRVPSARLVLKYRSLDAPSVSRRMLEQFVARGVVPERLELLGWSSHEHLMREYQRIDIALDTFPYSGGLTTCEALWMGVPVVTCPGDTFAGRHALTHLSNVGLPETIVGNIDEYVELAVRLSADLSRLGGIRARLRGQMIDSALCSGRRFASNFMVLIRGAWREWCIR